MDGREVPRPEGEEQIELAAEARREATAAMNQADDDAEDRLDDLANRARDARRRVEKDKAKADKGSLVGDRESARGLGVGLTVAYALMGAPLVGWLIGIGIDRAAGRETGFMPWLVILFSIAGLVFTVVTLQKHQS
jgi:F0F1-type ATP synthase assembly protein I